METLLALYFPYMFCGQINVETTESSGFNLDVEGF